MKKLIFYSLILLIFSSCAPEGGYLIGVQGRYTFYQPIPYGMLFIPLGSYNMGVSDQDVPYTQISQSKTVSVQAFYMDETEVTNFNWLEYLYWLSRVYSADYPEVYQKALPDTLVWRSKLGYNEPYVDYYLRHPAYRDYPVVGVSLYGA